MKKDWFTSWFDTPYYHILYKNRNNTDAQFFIKNIVDFLNIPKESKLVDIPCGKGRHSIFLNSLGYSVTGADLSSNSIEHAKKHENERLSFEVFDMRTPFTKKYDTIFNVFTSFGYFEDDAIDIQVLQNFKNGLEKNGKLVLDFLNVHKVAENLVETEVKTIDNIDFHIQRELKDGFILKHISFTDSDITHQYTERVKFIDLEKFESYFKNVGLEIEHIFGNYALEQFNKETSDRLIIVAK